MSNDINEIAGLAERALRIAQQAGADEVEVFGLTGRGVHIDIQMDTIDLAREGYTQGMGIKAVVNGAVGFSSTNDPLRLDDATRNAVRSARVRENDPDWKGLPAVSEYTTVAGIYDPRIADMDIDTCIDLALRMVDGAASVNDAVPTGGRFSCSGSSYLILNSSGVEMVEHTSRMDGILDCRSGDDNAVSTAYEFDISRNLDIDFYTIGREAARQAVASVGGVKVDSGETDILLRPAAIADLLESTLLPSLSAENVQKGRSALAGKLGSRIGAEGLIITDDGLLEGGIGSARSDDEGTPSRTNRIIEDGVLDTYLYDTYTAGKDGVDSTASAVRNNYTQTTTIGVRNLMIQYPASDVVGDMRRGVLVGSVIGAHTANPISGDFSVEARNSFVVEDGAIKNPVRSMMVSGNVFQLLHNITGAGHDVRRLGTIIAPTVRVSGLTVAG
ncbi:MAG: TldD/PmbA family protein [ANME-2 cluster archaeon]|nr:TldD/PmbA family protein [ANME-2 cluster archaeon]